MRLSANKPLTQPESGIQISVGINLPDINAGLEHHETSDRNTFFNKTRALIEQYSLHIVSSDLKHLTINPFCKLLHTWLDLYIIRSPKSMIYYRKSTAPLTIDHGRIDLTLELSFDAAVPPTILSIKLKNFNANVYREKICTEMQAEPHNSTMSIKLMTDKFTKSVLYNLHFTFLREHLYSLCVSQTNLCPTLPHSILSRSWSQS